MRFTSEIFVWVPNFHSQFYLFHFCLMSLYFWFWVFFFSFHMLSCFHCFILLCLAVGCLIGRTFWGPASCGHWESLVECVSRHWGLTKEWSQAKKRALAGSTERIKAGSAIRLLKKTGNEVMEEGQAFASGLWVLYFFNLAFLTE